MLVTLTQSLHSRMLCNISSLMTAIRRATNTFRGEVAFGTTLPEVKIANNWHCCSSMATNGSLKAKQRASRFAHRQASFRLFSIHL